MTRTLARPLAYTVSSDDCTAPVPLGFAAPLAESARRLAELGYDAVEIQVRDVDARDADAVRAAVEPCGLGIAGLGTGPVAAQDGLTLTDPSPDVRGRALDRLLGAARLAASLRVPLTLGQTRGTYRPGLEDTQHRWAEQAVRRLATTAAELGTRLLIEPQARANTSLWNSPDDTVSFLDTLPVASGLVLDTHHLRAEGIDPVAAAGAHAHRTGCLQLASDDGRGPLTAGDARLPALLDALRRGGFTGWLTLEHHQDGDSSRAATRSLAALHAAAPSP